MIYTYTMIKYDIKCGNDHVYESWFDSSSRCDELLKKKALECPICGDTNNSKAIMAPNVLRKERTRPKSDYMKAQEDKDKTLKWVKDNCENVGNNFADEVRAIHYGDKESRNISGITTNQETRELYNEGIPVINLGPIKEKGH